jgi:hypothetical protein
MSTTSAEPVAFVLPIKPWQRIATSLFATGMPVYDIAVQVNQPVSDISEFLTCSRGRDLLNSILLENKARLDELLDAAAVDSLLTLIKIRDTSKSESARISASKEILSKTLPGVKAREARRDTFTSNGQDPEDEIRALKEKVANI